MPGDRAGRALPSFRAVPAKRSRQIRGLDGVLHQLGCHANVEVEWAETSHSFDGLDDAVERFADSVAVGNDADRLARLREVLAARLQPLEDGRLASEQGRLPLATVWWEAGALREE